MSEATEREAVLDCYARFYGPLALAAIALLFTPIVDDVVTEVDDGSVIVHTYGTLWDIAGNGVPGAQLGILLAVLFAVFATTATFRPRSGRLPLGIVASAFPIIVLLILGPYIEQDPAPGLTTTGVVGLVLAVCATVLGAVHAIHYSILQARTRQRLSALYGARQRRM